MNLTVEGGNVKEFEFGGTSPSVPGRSVGMNYFSKVNWFTLVESFVCDETNFKLYPVFDREPMEFF